MIRRLPLPRTPLQVVVVLAAGLFLVAALVEGVDALVGDAAPSPSGRSPVATVPELDPEIRLEGSDGIVIDFGGHDKTRILIEGGEAEMATLARCLDEGLQRILEQEMAPGPGANQGWIGHIAAKRRMKNRFREVERKCMGLELSPHLLRPVVPGFPPASHVDSEGGEVAPPPEGQSAGS